MATPKKGGKNSANARAAVKNMRRIQRRKGKKPRWMKDRPVMKFGMGGTDKGFTRKPGVYYSDAPFER